MDRNRSYEKEESDQRQQQQHSCRQNEASDASWKELGSTAAAKVVGVDDVANGQGHQQRKQKKLSNHSTADANGASSSSRKNRKKQESMDLDDVLMHCLPYSFSYGDLSKLDSPGMIGNHAKVGGYEMQLSPNQQHSHTNWSSLQELHSPRGLSSAAAGHSLPSHATHSMQHSQYRHGLLPCLFDQGMPPIHFGSEEELNCSPIRLSHFVRNPFHTHCDNIAQTQHGTLLQQSCSHSGSPSIGGGSFGVENTTRDCMLNQQIHIGKVIRSQSFPPQGNANPYYSFSGEQFGAAAGSSSGLTFYGQESPLSAFERAIARHRSKGSTKAPASGNRKTQTKSTSRYMSLYLDVFYFMMQIQHVS